MSAPCKKCGYAEVQKAGDAFVCPACGAKELPENRWRVSRASKNAYVNPLLSIDTKKAAAKIKRRLMLGRMARYVLRLLLSLCAFVYPLLFLLLAGSENGLWPLLGHTAAWSLTCSGWLYQFCRQKWLGFSMGFYHAVTACTASTGVLWTGLTFMAGGAKDGLPILWLFLCTVLPYLAWYAVGRLEDDRGRFPTGTPPTPTVTVLYAVVIGQPFLLTAVRLASEWIYRDVPYQAMEYYRHTPPALYHGQMLAFQILLWLCLPLCLLAGWLAGRGKNA